MTDFFEKTVAMALACYGNNKSVEADSQYTKVPVGSNPTYRAIIPFSILLNFSILCGLL